MSLYSFIDSLQKKSESAKRKIILFSIFVSFIILSGLWVATLKNQIKEGGSAGIAVSDPKNKDGRLQLLGPFASLKEGFSLVIEDIKEKTGTFLSSTEDTEKAPGEDRNPIMPDGVANQAEDEQRSIFELPTIE